MMMMMMMKINVFYSKLSTQRRNVKNLKHFFKILNCVLNSSSKRLDFKITDSSFHLNHIYHKSLQFSRTFLNILADIISAVVLDALWFYIRLFI